MRRGTPAPRTRTFASADTAASASTLASGRSRASATPSPTASAFARWSAASWGFAATSTHDAGRRALAAAEAARLARAARDRCSDARSSSRRSPPVKGTWKTPITRDPIDVPIEEKVALLLAANEAALKVPKVSVRELGHAAAPRGEDARHDRRHARDADVRARRPAVHRHRDRRRRLPELHRGARAARLGLGVHRVARHAAQRRAAGRRSPSRSSRRASVEVGRYDLILASDEPLAHDPRIDRPSRPSSIARWATRRTTPARASSHRRRR